ncbi:MAG: aspartate aminotransferase family protein [Bacteroidales bacterium]|nr:aspartate aminotransferase family protein [Bacteroidales bacterium]
MSIERQLFYQKIAQTTSSPIGLEISSAKGCYLYTPEGKPYIDLISGVAVSNIGHCHPRVVEAVQKQAAQYMHLMVYGEYIQSPQVQYAELLTSFLPANLDNIYYVNSGSEAVEGALKLAKRFTGRAEIVHTTNAYHGSTHGAISLMGNEEFRYAFRPLLPNTRAIRFNNIDDLELITEQTACVILDPLQSENGLVLPTNEYLLQLRKKCTQVGALLIFDEVQTGFGRTGSMFYFQQTVVPDILVIAKAMGGGMPIGAFVSSKEIMNTLTFNPILGHITTFGGHPVSCAAALESLKIISEENLHVLANDKGKRFEDALKDYDKLKSIRRQGLFLACDLESEEVYWKLLDRFLHNGLVTDSFLYKLNSFRIAPPLTITDQEIDEAIYLVKKSLDEI